MRCHLSQHAILTMLGPLVVFACSTLLSERWSAAQSVAQQETERELIPRGSRPSSIGFSVRRDAESVEAFADHVSFVIDRGWMTYGDSLIQKARSLHLPVILEFHSKERTKVGDKIVPLVSQNRDVVRGICWASPYYNNYEPEAVSVRPLH